MTERRRREPRSRPLAHRLRADNPADMRGAAFAEAQANLDAQAKARGWGPYRAGGSCPVRASRPTLLVLAERFPLSFPAHHVAERLACRGVLPEDNLARAEPRR